MYQKQLKKIQPLKRELKLQTFPIQAQTRNSTGSADKSQPLVIQVYQMQFTISNLMVFQGNKALIYVIFVRFNIMKIKVNNKL